MRMCLCMYICTVCVSVCFDSCIRTKVIQSVHSPVPKLHSHVTLIGSQFDGYLFRINKTFCPTLTPCFFISAFCLGFHRCRSFTHLGSVRCPSAPFRGVRPKRLAEEESTLEREPHSGRRAQGSSACKCHCAVML